MTTQVNPTLSADEQIFKKLVWEPFIMAGETWLFTAVPVLNAPVLGAVDKEIISIVSDYIFDKVRLLFDIGAIKFLNAEHQAAYVTASLQLKIVLQTKGVNSDEYQTALQNAVAAQIALTRVNQ